MASDINYASWPRHVGRHIDVGDQKQLFLDDGFLVERAEGIRYVMHQPVKHPHNPLLVPDMPWELQVQLYGSVLWDEEDQTYKMWYTNRTHKYGKDSAVLMAYATSEDGLKWTKPTLDILPHEGSAKTNLLLDPGPGGSGGVCVLKTPEEKNPNKKYKMLYKTIEEGGGLKIAFSPDGIHWAKHPKTVLPGVFDTFNVAVQDNDKYVAYVRINQRPRKRHRSLGRIESEDFIHWTTPISVLRPDEHDPEDTDIYTSAAFKYPQADYAYIMMPSLFDWRTGKLQVQLATSRDNANWRRAGNRDIFIPLGEPNSYESAEIMVGAPSVVKDQIHIYYHGSNRPHWNGMGRPFEEKSGIGLATLRLDGFISIDAGEKPSGGTITTVPIQFSGTRLEINADATWGEIRVEILNDENEVIEGFDRQSCEPVIGDFVRHRVSWSGGDVRTLIGTTVKLRFYILCARLYAFQFRTNITQQP